jgi:predicted enzyme related to lactoylglutathione lyase
MELSWLNAALRYLAGANGDSDVVDHPGCFAWYELITTDVSAAEAFYGDVVGWEAQDASTPDLPYRLFTAGKVSICGLMNLPEEGRNMGARPRWMGYVGVDDVKLTAARIQRFGGAVYVPATNTNIGLISVVADPQIATFALVNGLRPGRQQPAESGKPGHVGWHELHAADWEKVFAFYGEIFGWQKADAEISHTDAYQLFSVGGLRIGGMCMKRPAEPLPFWLFYFNVGDIDAAAKRVKAGGGQVYEGPLELPGGIWIARCADPQGAAFALQGKRSHDSKLGWSTEWSGFSSRGRLLAPKRRERTPDSDS